MSPKKIKGTKVEPRESVIDNRKSYDTHKPIWMFDMIDRDGEYAFDIGRQDFNAKEVLNKIISYSTMTWAEINRQTHDNGKSKHHYLDCNRLSDIAKERLKRRCLDEHSDALYSFAFQNKMRVVGIKEQDKFHVLWYDPQHGVYPTER